MAGPAPRMRSLNFYPSDFLNDPHVIAMGIEARGIYVTLLCHAWEMVTPGVLPADEACLARLAWCSADEWERNREAVARCFEVGPDTWTQKRMHREWVAQKTRLHQASARSRMANKIRWDREIDPTGTPNGLPSSLFSESKIKEKDSLSPLPPSRKRSAREREPEGFAEFFQAYPRPVGRRAAAKAFAAALKRHPTTYSFSDLILGAEEYARQVVKEGREVQYVPHPATWLNQDRFRELFDEEVPGVETENPGE